MLRSLLRASAAVAFAFLLAPAAPSAAPGAGLAYEEIVRVVINATPPPPGNFQADLASANAPVATPTPAPRKHGIGGLAGLAGAVLTGGGAGAVGGAVAGAVVGDVVDNAIENSLGNQFSGLAATMRGFLQPHVMRYAYWNGWERVDDVGAQTATIRKCDLGQVLQLDLAKRTYTIISPDAEPTPSAPAAPPPRRGRAAPPDPGQPGTAVATLSETTKSLGPLRIDNEPTAGYDATTSFATTQATGSCRNGSVAIQTVSYISPLLKPAVNSCPIRRPPVPQTAGEAVTPQSPTGGCRPTFQVQRSGPPVPNRLAMYSLVTFKASGGTPTPQPNPAASPGMGTLGFLTERGGIKLLGPADAGLFGIPAGFTKAP